MPRIKFNIIPRMVFRAATSIPVLEPTFNKKNCNVNVCKIYLRFLGHIESNDLAGIYVLYHVGTVVSSEPWRYQ